MKKLLSVLILIFAFALIFTACDDKTTEPAPEHVHEFGEWVTDVEPSVTEEGTLKRTCACSASETQPIEKLIPSEGLKFVSNGDGTCYLDEIGDCTDKNVIIPAISPEGDTVIEIGLCAFQNTDITGVIVPDTVTSILGSAFNECASLTSIKLGKGVTFIDDVAFPYCTSLESIVIPEGVEYIGDYAFSACSALKNVSIPNSLTYMGANIFFDCNELVFNTHDYLNYIGNETNPNLILVKVERDDMPFYNIDPDTKFIYDSAFNSCHGLKEIVIPEGVLGINEYAFSYCEKLTNIEIPASVTSIKPEAFTSCYSMTDITVNENNATYKSADGAVYTKDGTVLVCYATANPATTFIIPEGVTEIADSAFCGSLNLIHITLPESILVINDSAFSLCYDLTEIVIPKNVTVINSFAFSHCSSLEKVYIGKNVTIIDSYAFSNNLALTDIYFEGSEAEWNAIVIEDHNECLATATVHYNYTPEN